MWHDLRLFLSPSHCLLFLVFLILLVLWSLASLREVPVGDVHELELLVAVVVVGLVLFPPVDIGGSCGKTDAIGHDEGHSQAHDHEQRLKGHVFLQGLDAHALDGPVVLTPGASSLEDPDKL